MNKVTITLDVDADATTKVIANAVRRAFAEDIPVPAGTLQESKGVTIAVVPSPVGRKGTLQEVREYAAKKGIKTGSRGRVPNSLLVAFAADQAKKPSK